MPTGRLAEARYILRTFAHHVRDGLIPNLFPEGDREGLYHTADATLWFFHAVGRYLEASGDAETLDILLPILLDVVERHLAGTRFGIGVDPADGLLRQGAEGYQLTWMDAKVGDRVVTPRTGKAVEINALWLNALAVMASFARRLARPASPWTALAARVRASFDRFWNEAAGHCYDVIDGPAGPDGALRPNQLFAVALPESPLSPERQRRVVDVCARELLGYRCGTYRFAGGTASRALIVTFANSAQFGNGARIAPGARLDDGLLDMVVFEESSRLATLWALPRLFTGGVAGVRGVSVQQVERATLESDAPMAFHVDGEPVQGGARLEARVHPGVLRVCV